MKLWLLLMASLMTSCYITAAPPPQPGKAPFHIPPGQAKKVAEEVKEVAEGALQLKLEYIVKKAELELQELELKAEVFQAIQEHFSDVQLSPEQLLLLRHQEDSSSDEDEMSPEQKLLEAKLLQGLAMDHEQLLRLAELRALKSGMSTIQELFLLHHANMDLTPQQIAILKAFSPSQLLKYYIFNNSGSDLLASLADKLSELARGKILLENNEALLYSLLKNHQPHQRRISLTDLALIQNYQEAMSQSMRRSRFLLMMHMMGMSLDVEDMTPEEKTILASMIHRAEQQKNEKWMKEEALLLRRYRQGEATLAGTMLAYRHLEAAMNSGLGDHLRTLVTNEIRMKLVRGSGIGMNPDGTWMNGWMNGEQWMNASDSERLSELWELYKLRYVRNYNDRGEERMRRRNFESKVSEMIMHNMEAKLKQQFYTMALNNLTDWAQEELDKLRGYTSISSTQVEDDLEAQEKDVEEGERARVALPVMPTYTNTVPTSQLPASVNWSSTNWVGPVQNQYQCGSCWSFSAAGALEAQYYNKTQTFVAMSEQNLVDCTYYLGNLGCSGGNVELAFDYVMTVGIDNLASYPYTGRDNNGTCLYNAANSVTQTTSWRLIPSGNELALQQAVALAGPVSVAIDASLSSFDSYSGGVYAPTNCSTTALDHAVLVVGYGTTSDGQDYWLIKNSWGVDWGINGYMMMERGVNMCGIATEALFPVID